jgi:CHAT domain-containing protein
MSLNLDKTELVILSACETGLGEVRNGEGVYGLQRALKIAGAKSIIISLWKVNDVTTQKLMNVFYSELLATNDKKKSFRAAQESIKKEFPHPYYWGAFMLIGN